MIKFVKKDLCKIIEKFSTKSEREIKKLNFQYDEEWNIFIQDREHTL